MLHVYWVARRICLSQSHKTSAWQNLYLNTASMFREWGKDIMENHTLALNTYALKWHLLLAFIFHWSKQVIFPSQSSKEWEHKISLQEEPRIPLRKLIQSATPDSPTQQAQHVYLVSPITCSIHDFFFFYNVCTYIYLWLHLYHKRNYYGFAKATNHLHTSQGVYSMWLRNMCKAPIWEKRFSDTQTNNQQRTYWKCWQLSQNFEFQFQCLHVLFCNIVCHF